MPFFRGESKKDELTKIEMFYVVNNKSPRIRIGSLSWCLEFTCCPSSQELLITSEEMRRVDILSIVHYLRHALLLLSVSSVLLSWVKKWSWAPLAVNYYSEVDWGFSGVKHRRCQREPAYVSVAGSLWHWLDQYLHKKNIQIPIDCMFCERRGEWLYNCLT